MKKFLIIVFVSVYAISTMVSCNRKLLPGDVLKAGDKSYDSAAFDYVFVEAIKMKMAGNAGEALRYFEQCIRLNPQSDASYYQMAQILFSAGDVITGRKYLLKAIENAPLNKWYPVMMAGTYYQTGNLDSAIYFYEKAVKISPEKEDVQLTLGKLYSENKEYDRAAKIFDELDRKYGINESSTLAAVKNYMESNKYQEAYSKIIKLIESNPEEILYSGMLAEIYRGLGETEKAAEVYTRLLEKSPDNPGTLLSLSSFLLQEKNYDDLMKVLTPVVMNKVITKEEKLGLFSSILEDKEFLGKYSPQLQVTAMVLEAAYPGDNICQMVRPEILLGTNERESAIRILEEIVDKNKGNYFAWEKLLFTYMEAKEYVKLQSRAEECAGLFNRSFIIKILYATGAIENKNYDTALGELGKAQILAGSDTDMLMQVYPVKADLYYRMKDFNKAYQTFEEALKINPEDLTTLNNYAYYLTEQDLRLKDAEKMSKKVITIEKSNSTFLDTYAWVLYKRGKNREALKIMQDISQNENAMNAELYEHFGFILKKGKDCKKAVEMWNKAIELDNSKTELLKQIKDCTK